MLTKAVLAVETDEYVLLHSFTASDPKNFVLKGYLLNATADNLNLKFSTLPDSLAFINTMKIVDIRGLKLTN